MIVILTLAIVVPTVLSVWFYREIKALEQMLELQTEETEYYSKLSLDHVEEIFALRIELENLKAKNELVSKVSQEK
jgi:hypothetical protein